MGDDIVQREPLPPDTDRTKKAAGLIELLVRLDSLGDAEMTAGASCTASHDFKAAVQHYEQAEKAYTQARIQIGMLADILPPDDDGTPGRKKKAEGLASVLGRQVVLANCWKEWSHGQLSKVTRNPGEAVLHFAKARDGFRGLHDQTKEGQYGFLAEYAAILEPECQGLECLARGNDAGAKALLQRAKGQMQNLIENTTAASLDIQPEQFDPLKAILVVELATVEMEFLYADARDQFSRGNFATAAKQYSKLCDIHGARVDPKLKDFPQVLRSLVEMEYYLYSGFRYVALGESAREQKRWDEALESYDRAREEWMSGAAAALKSGIPEATAVQEALVNQSAGVESYRRSTGRERDLCGRIEDLESTLKGLQTALAPAGVTVQNFQEVRTNVEQNVQIVQAVERNAREALQGIVDKVDDTGLDEGQKTQIRDKTRELLQSAERGPSFLERVKKVTADIAAIVGNAAAIAQPIVPFLQMLQVFK
jgi:tetratricopeptide (TPR) repeat protein